MPTAVIYPHLLVVDSSICRWSSLRLHARSGLVLASTDVAEPCVAVALFGLHLVAQRPRGRGDVSVSVRAGLGEERREQTDLFVDEPEGVKVSW